MVSKSSFADGCANEMVAWDLSEASYVSSKNGLVDASFLILACTALTRCSSIKNDPRLPRSKNIALQHDKAPQRSGI